MGEKTKKYNDVINYPVSLVAAAEVILTSDEHYDFEPSGLASFAIRNSTLVADYLTAGTIIVSPQISFDEGTTYLDAGTMVGYQDFEASDDVPAVAEISTGVITLAVKATYEGKWFVLYDGTTPTFVWFDITGSDPKPTGEGYDSAADVDIDVSSIGGANVDDVGAILNAHAGLSTAGFTGAYNSGTDTIVFTVDTSGVCTNIDVGNTLTATVVFSSFAVTTQGVNAITGHVAYNHVVDIAPRVRVQAVLDASAALTEGHGCQTDIQMTEVHYGMRKKVFADVVTVPATAVSGFTYYSSSLVIDDLGLDQMKKVWLFAYVDDLSKVTDTVAYALETSNDNVNWRVCSAVGSDIANGANQLHTLVTVTHGSTYYLGKYLRVHFYGALGTDITGALAADHGIQFNVIVGY